MSIVVSHHTFINEPHSKLYSRLISGDGWEKWFASEAIIGGQVGDEVSFQWENFGADNYTASDMGKIVSLNENSLFAFTWHPGANETLVSLQFRSSKNGCFLSVEETGYSNTAEDLDVALKVASGWGEALTLLKMYVEHGILYGNTD